MVAARDALRLPRLYARAAAKDMLVRDIGLRGQFAGAATKRGTTMRRWNNQIKTVLLLGALSAAFVGMGSALGAGYLYAFALLAMALNLGAYFFSDRLVLRLHGARQVGPEEIPRLHEMVAELAHAMGIPKPRILVIEDDHANAFATGRNPSGGRWPSRVASWRCSRPASCAPYSRTSSGTSGTATSSSLAWPRRWLRRSPTSRRHSRFPPSGAHTTTSSKNTRPPPAGSCWL